MKSFIILFILFQTSCAVGPDFKKPKGPNFKEYTSGDLPDETASADGISQTFKNSKVPEKWWKLFHSTKLDPIVDQVLKGNQSLKAMVANLEQSQNNLRAGYGVFYPQVSVGFNGAHQKSNPATVGGNFPSRIFDLLTLSGTVSYVLDIFGGQRRAVEGLGAQVEYQSYLVLASYLTLTGNALNTIVARAAYQDQVEATEEILKILREQIVITQGQATAGTVSYSSVLTLQSQLSSLEATLPALRLKINQADHLLAVLSGAAPSEWAGIEDIKLSDLVLPRDLPKTLPSELVRQRPDILASEAELHMASAQVGVATAAMYPSFTLSGTYGNSKNSLSGLTGPHNDFWSIGGGITAPIFKGGSLSANRDAAKSAYQASLSTYRDVTLKAFAQVADTLRAIEADALILQSQAEALKASKESLDILQVNYKSGIANYLQVLTADLQYQQTRLNYIQSVAQRLQDSIALFIALGGGWTVTEKKP